MILVRHVDLEHQRTQNLALEAATVLLHPLVGVVGLLKVLAQTFDTTASDVLDLGQAVRVRACVRAVSEWEAATMRGTLCETGANVRCSNLLQLLRDGRALAVVVAALHLDGRLLGQQRVLFASSLTERFAELLRLLLHRLNVGL